MPIHLLIPKLSLAAAALGLLAAGPVLADAALPDGLYAQISTPRGVITCELEYARTPLTVVNFVGLAEGTLGPAPRRPFFDGLKFHRVVPHFVIQGGDPLNTGEGGPGYAFADEFSPGLSNDVVGALSMANEGPDTNGSQFFLTLEPVGRLDYLHTVFGRTVGGAEVLRQVAAGDPMTAAELAEKWHDCLRRAAPGLAPAESEALLARADCLGAAPPIAPWLRSIVGAIVAS